MQCLVYKHMKTECSPRYLCLERGGVLGTAVDTYGCSTGEVETKEDPWVGLLSQPVLTNGQHPGSMRDPVSKDDVESDFSRYPILTLNLHMFLCMHMHKHTGTHICTKRKI